MPPDPPPDADAVAAWLRAHPRFLAERPALYRALEPPARVHGEALADHMAAMIAAERAHAAVLAQRADGVLAAGRAAAGLAQRVQEAVIALVRAQNKLDCITSELPSLLAVDAVSVCSEGGVLGIRPLPAGTVARLLGARAVVFREANADAALLHAEAARLAAYEALLLVPGEGPPMLLALVSRDGAALDPAQGAGALTFLGRAVAAVLGR